MKNYSVHHLKVLADIVTLFLLFAVFTTKVKAQFDDELNSILSDKDEWQVRNSRWSVRNQYASTCVRPENGYICEEPPEVIPPEVLKQCNYRNINYHEQIYRWVAGRGCLEFMPNFLFVEGRNPFNLNMGCSYGYLGSPCLEIMKEDGTCACYPYDPTIEVVVNTIRDAVISSAQDRWERCFQVAAQCCSHVMGDSNSVDYNIKDMNSCGPTFDGWTCWDETPVDTVADEICSEFAYSNSGPTCFHFSTKQCFGNGTWELQTDYSPCSITPRFHRRYLFHIAMLSVSIILCLPAVFIFFFYKRLRVTRVILHRNLLIAIIIRNILVIISRSEIYIDEITNTGDTVMSTHGVWCRVLSVAERTAGNAVFVCMLIEGIYLHRLIAAVFRKKLNVNLLYGIGAVITIVPVIIWGTVMGIHNDHSCWLIYTIDHVQWILDVPRLCILLINTGLFIDVLRVLLTKLRNSENANQLSTTKATLFLMPIFGSQFLLTAFRPNTTVCSAEEAYYFITYTIEGLQGIIVAMLYCYVNKEVHGLVKATYRKTENAVVSIVRRDSNYRRTTLGFNSRRMTFSTGLEPNQIDETDKDKRSSTTSKVNVAEIVSIQNSKRLAHILEPVYEIVETGKRNDTYDSLDRFVHSAPTENGDDYSKTSSIADARDWVKCISSPSSSLYYNSLNDYEVNYLERKFANRAIKSSVEPITEQLEVDEIAQEPEINCSNQQRLFNEDNEINENIAQNNENNNAPTCNKNIDDVEDSEMYKEIMEYIESSNIILDPTLLSPNRQNGEKIVFVD